MLRDIVFGWFGRGTAATLILVVIVLKHVIVRAPFSSERV
jgi:hypothetical protein